MSQKAEQIGRLALREQGDYWNAYYARPDSMEDAVLLGSIRIVAVKDPKRKQEFIDLMRNVVADIIEDMTGRRPVWKAPQTAPERERGEGA